MSAARQAGATKPTDQEIAIARARLHACRCPIDDVPLVRQDAPKKDADNREFATVQCPVCGLKAEAYRSNGPANLHQGWRHLTGEL